MLRRTTLSQLRVLCLTMLPDGGALTPALKQLGYTPYTLRSSFQQGHASTHPIEWSKLLDGTAQTLPPALLADYDSVVGPPGAMLYTTLLRQAPQYTKVILVEEADKDRWAADYEAYMARLQKATKRASKNKIARAFQNMLAKMVVGGEATTVAQSSATATGSSSAALKDKKREAGPTASAKTARSPKMTASSSDLRKTFAAEAAAMSGKSAPKKHPSEAEGAADEEAVAASAAAEKGEDSAELQHPRAIALQLFEESVKMSVPSSQLLVYRYGDGWEPLCSFLEKAVPTGPFPDYDDGLRVLGNLQERIEYAHTLQYFLVGLCVVCLLITVIPRCGGVTQFFSDLYTDYQVAFGNDDAVAAAAVAKKQRSGNAEAQLTEAEKFDEEWRKRGGAVTRTRSA